MTEKCGAETTSGEPCQNPADSCPWHNTENPPENGRPSKLTHAKQEAIAADIEQGRSMRSAARKQDLTPQTVMNWMQRGESDLEEDKANEYTDFFERITRAKGYGEEWYMQTIIELAQENEDHRFLMSLMKQRYPDSWGETETGVDASEVTVESEVVEVTRDTV
jgi:transposase-like protein